MKKIKILLMMCFVVNFYFSQTLPISQNYVYSRQYLEAVTTETSTAKQIQSVVYFDGLGRPKQNISIKASKSGKDLVVPVEFVEYGRQVKNYLPIPVASLNGNIQPIVGADVNSYYDNLYGNASNAYSENVFDESPLNILKQSAFPGDDWKKNSTHTQDYEYDVNKTSDVVKKYTAITSWDSTEEIYKSTLGPPGSYLTGELYKYKITDEDRNIQEVYRNSFGQTILVRKNDGVNNIDTYYVYDIYEHLSFIITPKADLLTIIDPEFLPGLCYQYNYDEWGRLAEKKLPGKEWEFFAYDKYDRLVATQDTKLNSEGKWQFTKFDHLGRVAYTGIATGSDRKVFQTSLNSSNATEMAAGLSSVINGWSLHYSNQKFPTAISELLSINVYDYYPSDTPAIASPVLGQSLLTDDSYTLPISTMSLPTASYLKNIGEDKWTKSYIWYDTKGRGVATHTKNHLGGFTKTETELDFVGIPKKTITQNSRISPTTPNVTIEENFTYDDQYRLKKHEHEVVGKSAKETLAEYVYNDIGQLTVKNVGGSSGTPLQKISYKYNVRGWLTDINDLDSLNINNEGDLFAYKIRYNSRAGLEYPSNDYPTYQVKKKYNGNIAEVDWISLSYPGQVASDAINAERYGYVYDSLDRLKAGFYQKPFDRGNGVNSEIIPEYDLNGNIEKLKRFARKTKSNIPAKIDDLVYNYTGNQLTSIIDNPLGAPNPAGYEGGGGTIEYDPNGNMTLMPDKGITNIDYNFLNLPNTVEQRGNISQYSYRADGVKLKRMFTLNNALGGNTTTTEYLDGFHYSQINNPSFGRALAEPDDITQSVRTAGEEEIYIDDFAVANRKPDDPPQIALGLMFFPTAEGFYDFRKEQYIYQYKDQIGNVRSSYWVDPDDQVLKVLDRNDYYPFGMNIVQESEFSVTTSPLNYKFQEQELQESGFYSFKWRNYMPDVGRFFNVDPLSEKYAYQSHYNFSENRVVNAREIEGLEAKDNYQPSSFDGQNYDGGIDETNREETLITSVRLGWKELGKSETMLRENDLGENERDFGSGNGFTGDVDKCIIGCHNPGGAMPDSNIDVGFNNKENLFNFSGGNNEPDVNDRFRQGNATVERSDLFAILYMIYGNSGNPTPTNLAPWARRLGNFSDAADKTAGLKEKFLQKGKSNDTLITIDWSYQIDIGNNAIKIKDTFLQMHVQKNNEGNYQISNNREIKSYTDSVNKVQNKNK